MRLRQLKRLLWMLVVSVGGGAACRGPAWFWKSYDTEHILDSSNDQGPWGGTSWVQWQADQLGTFRVSAVVTFAKDNGWECEDPREVSADELSEWVIGDKPIFPWVYGAAEYESIAMPRHIERDAFLSRCETGWTRVEPGTDDATPAFAYILIQGDGCRMAVYHHWGEG